MSFHSIGINEKLLVIFNGFQVPTYHTMGPRYRIIIYYFEAQNFEKYSTKIGKLWRFVGQNSSFWTNFMKYQKRYQIFLIPKIFKRYLSTSKGIQNDTFWYHLDTLRNSLILKMAAADQNKYTRESHNTMLSIRKFTCT